MIFLSMLLSKLALKNLFGNKERAPLDYHHLIDSFISSNITKNFITGNLSLTQDYTTVLVECSSEDITITLPLANLYPGITFNVKKIDSTGYNVIIQPSGSNTIDGDTEEIITAQWTNVVVQSNGTNWYKL